MDSKMLGHSVSVSLYHDAARFIKDVFANISFAYYSE